MSDSIVRQARFKQALDAISELYGSLHPLKVTVECTKCEWKDDALYIVGKYRAKDRWKPHLTESRIVYCKSCSLPLELEEITENGDICEACDFAQWAERDAGSGVTNLTEVESRCRVCKAEIKHPETEWVEHYLKHRNEAMERGFKKPGPVTEKP